MEEPGCTFSIQAYWFESKHQLLLQWSRTDKVLGIYEEIRDADAYYTGLYVFAWSNTFYAKHLNETTPTENTDYLKHEFKDKLVLTYPNDDDAVLYQFDLM